MIRRGSGARRNRGYLLVATLWVLAGITVAAGYFAERVNRSRETALRAQHASRSLVEFDNTRAEILFRLATSRPSVYGLGDEPAFAVRLDGRPYRGTGDDIVRLQDQRGLANLNHPDRDFLFQLLGQLGFAVEKRDRLLDTLFDYTDADELRRLNGAEARDYASAGLPPPRNDWLTMPHQLRNILGWRDEAARWKEDRFVDFFTTSRVFGINLNTAPLEVLASMPGNNRELASLIVRLRRETPFASASHAARLTGNALLDGEMITVIPSNSLRITQNSSRLPWLLQYSVTLTPTSPDGPWRVDYFTRRPAPSVTESEDDVAPLPARATQPAASTEAL